MFRFALFVLPSIIAQMVLMDALDTSKCWIQIYRQKGNPEPEERWKLSTINTCTIQVCRYIPLHSDMLNFEPLSDQDDNGFAFYFVWDDVHFLTWKQELNPFLLVPDYSNDDFFNGEYYYYGVSETIWNHGSLLDFRGLGVSSDAGVLMDGRNNFGAWFAVGFSEENELVGHPDTKIPAWRTKSGEYYMANTAILYLWDTGCGSWIIPSFSPTNPPTNPPTIHPSPVPTFQPSESPTPSPTSFPTRYPTKLPTTDWPTQNPSAVPTSASPTSSAPTSAAPTFYPSRFPTESFTPNPSSQPTENPTLLLTFNPTPFPTAVLWTAVDVESDNDNQFLLMLTGFSAGGFLVVCFFLILCWKRLDGARSDDVHKTMVEIERIRTSRIKSLENKTVSDPRDFIHAPAMEQHVSNMSYPGVSPHMSHSYPGRIVVNSRPSFDGNPIPGQCGYWPVEIMRKPSVSRSRSYIPSAQTTPRGNEESSRMEPSYPSILPVMQIPMELSARSTTADEVSVIHRRTQPQRQSSSSYRVVKRGRRKEKERIRRRVSPVAASETDSDSSPSSSFKQKTTCTARRKSKGVLEDMWSKGQAEAYLQDLWSDEDLRDNSIRIQSTSAGGILRRDDSIVLRKTEDYMDPTKTGGGKFDIAEQRRWRKELSRDTQSMRSLRMVDENSSLYPGVCRTPSITHSETSPQKDMSHKELSLHLVQKNGGF